MVGFPTALPAAGSRGSERVWLLLPGDERCGRDGENCGGDERPAPPDGQRQDRHGESGEEHRGRNAGVLDPEHPTVALWHDTARDREVGGRLCERASDSCDAERDPDHSDRATEQADCTERNGGEHRGDPQAVRPPHPLREATCCRRDQCRHAEEQADDETEPGEGQTRVGADLHDEGGRQKARQHRDDRRHEGWRNPAPFHGGGRGLPGDFGSYEVSLS